MSKKEIKSAKILIKDLFHKDKWYRIPNYQRPYVWGDDQINDLLDDISYAANAETKSEYFLGSIVLHSKNVNDNGIEFVENDVLDGQQRLTTLYMLTAVIRDLTDNKTRKTTCQDNIFQKENPDYNIPERLRIVYDTRDDVKKFINTYIKEEGGTEKIDELKKHTQNGNDISIKNMSYAILKIREYFLKEGNISLDKFFPFLSNYVLLIYVASDELDDAFRLFTILNDRGIKLRNSDILKASNLKAYKDSGGSDKNVQEYAEIWEDIENELGEDFDQFLSYIRTIIVKEKPRLSLLKEFEENIYKPTRYNHTTKEKYSIPALVEKGSETFEFIKKYHKHYNEIFSNKNYHLTNTWHFDNLLNIMQDTIPADLWIPPLMSFREHFGEYKIYDFLVKLDNKFSADWISRETPTKRIEAMNNILKKIEEINTNTKTNEEKVDELLASDVFNFDETELFRTLETANVYGKRYARYILYKLDMIYGNNDNKKDPLKTISVEHILPQNPKDDSQWKKDWTDEQREEWVHKLGNLVLLSRRKNSSQGRLDYKIKKSKYFDKNIDAFANSIRILNKNSQWTPAEVKANHKTVIDDLKIYYRK